MPKKQPKNREELVADFKRREEIKRKHEIIVNSFYPAIKESTKSIDEAKMLMQAISSLLMQEVLGWMKDKKFSDISDILLKKLCPDGEREEEIVKLLKTLESETIFVAKELVEGMSMSIDYMINKEMRERKLDSLKDDWDNMLN